MRLSFALDEKLIKEGIERIRKAVEAESSQPQQFSRF